MLDQFPLLIGCKLHRNIKYPVELLFGLCKVIAHVPPIPKLFTRERLGNFFLQLVITEALIFGLFFRQ
ncbi:Uncharacterised protein [Vibrio cholerae]|uniref:Uncharacterized protein n=1 Tax=Vibrio cholerae TaxID=666 RepID=A0A655YNU6_VIBCL|nr:Uncharacterised protein [Vibrio cholerae]CSA74915.1 Uncharacterised protein [Vibrio cholerae]CSB52279.1 Uncharacterised protein [Vibrio cholerae]CSB99291.1 Uncharacterised protein [Vibrio cholerae]CSC45980.1 Uncharacterised protein [Vibrio cholerae]